MGKTSNCSSAALSAILPQGTELSPSCFPNYLEDALRRQLLSRQFPKFVGVREFCRSVGRSGKLIYINRSALARIIKRRKIRPQRIFSTRAISCESTRFGATSTTVNINLVNGNSCRIPEIKSTGDISSCLSTMGHESQFQATDTAQLAR